MSIGKVHSFNLLKKSNVKKIIIKGGDMVWFCTRLALANCRLEGVKLLASYPADVKKYNLYSLK